MEPERWRQVEQIYYAALERDASQRVAFLDQACAGNEELRREVESLLAAHEQAGSFLVAPALAVEAKELAAEQRQPQTHSLIGQRVNHYQVLSWLGAGGMGEVYLALDTKLDRKVALKLLPARFMQDAERSRRFLREAKAASALNHPNIITIHEIGEVGKLQFIAAEYIEGMTLRQRLKTGKLELREALDIAIQITAALEAAHKAGIVHRDIKPENVMLRPDGYVKVLDFGLAKLSQRQSPADDEHAQLVTGSSTESGLMMGTPRYMSPEQARGVKIDGRTDIFSFGVVFYEMLTGQPPFAGETTADLIVALLNNEPEPLSQSLPGVPVELERIVKKALAKDRKERYQAIKDLEGELQVELARLHQPKSQAPLTRISAVKRIYLLVLSLSWRRWSTIAIGVLAVLLIAGVVWQFLHRPASLSESSLRSSLRISELLNAPNLSGRGLSDLSFSPDGKLIAYSLNNDEESHLWIKQVADGEPKQITAGKYRDHSPLWSPDGQELAFISNRSGTPGIWSVPYLGGTPKLLSRIENVNGILIGWSQNGQTLYFESSHNLCALDPISGRISLMTHFDFPPSEAQGFKVSPDEKLIAYLDLIDKKDRIMVMPLRGGEARPITRDKEGYDRSPAWFPDGQRIAYISRRNDLFQICLTGLNEREPTQITFGNENYDSLTVSPDGTRIAAVSAKANANLFSCDLRTGTETRQTSELNLQLSPEISSDGKMMAFQALKNLLLWDDTTITVQSLVGDRQAVRLAHASSDQKWSPVEDTLAFLHIPTPDHQAELWKVSASGRDERRLTTGVLSGGLTRMPFNRLSTNYNWSPDGRQIAYISDKSGQCNLWAVASDGSSDVMISHNTDPKLKITSPFWSPRGDLIAYVSELGRKRSIYVIEGGKNETVYEDEKPLRLIGWSMPGQEIIVAVVESKGSPVFPQELSLLRIPIGTKRLKIIARTPATYLHNIKLSHDGRSLAFVSRHDGKNDIEIVSTSGGAVRKVTSNNDPTVYFSGLTWLPDGKTLFYSRQTSWTLVSMIETLK